MIAYLILIHRYPAQFKRMFKSIYDPDHHYVVHADKNSGAALHADILDFLSDYPNAEMLESKAAVWGGYSLVDAELRGIAKLLKMNRGWEYFINLSGQDFPLKTQGYISDFLANARGSEFIKMLDQRKARPETMPRVLDHVSERENRIVPSGYARPFLRDAKPCIGNQWMMVSRKYCEYVSHDPEVSRYKDFYRNTFIPDEGFFQTVMMNSAAHGPIVNNDMRSIDWVPDGDIKLRPRTFTAADAGRLLASDNLFARKFDADTDSKIIDVLECQLQMPQTLPAAAVNAALSMPAKTPAAAIRAV